MAYRQPAFMYNHHAADEITDLADITTTSSLLTDDEKRMLIDRRVGDLAVWGVTAESYIQFDFGAGVVVNRMVIPEGHSLMGEGLEIEYDDHAGFTSPTVLDSWTQSSVATGVIDRELAVTSERFWRLTALATGAGDYEVGEVWFGIYRELSTTDGSAVDPRFESNYASQITEVVFPGGEAAVELGAARRVFSLSIKNVEGGGTNWTVLQVVQKTGRVTPFYYWPPDDDEPGPYLVKLSEDGFRVQEFSSPSVSTRYQIDLKMIEQLL